MQFIEGTERNEEPETPEEYKEKLKKTLAREHPPFKRILCILH